MERVNEFFDSVSALSARRMALRLAHLRRVAAEDQGVYHRGIYINPSLQAYREYAFRITVYFDSANFQANFIAPEEPQQLQQEPPAVPQTTQVSNRRPNLRLDTLPPRLRPQMLWREDANNNSELLLPYPHIRPLEASTEAFSSRRRQVYRQRLGEQ